jgi:threonine dehydrogenase-like Zn-dependent dehydrogenase
MLGVAMGARVIAIDVGGARRELGRELGADAVLDPGATDVVAALKGLTGGEGVDAALDCTGHPDARLAAVRATRTWGRVGLVGEGNQVTFDVSPDLLRRQLTIHASWTFSTLIQEECARFIVKRAVPLTRLLTHRFRLPEADDAYRLFDTQTTGKGVFVFD